ncbi:MAG: ABC transporter ATP-binding protein [Chloroflexi bacterium]|nr:ABC transporter ATP-binding protein [Chloroflexota bacterium]
MDDPPLICLDQVHFGFDAGHEIIRGVTLELSGGAVLGLMGPSGAGKSSIARLMNGLLRPSSGQVLLEGLDLRARPVSEIAKSVGYVFQNPLHQLFTESVRREVGLGVRKQPDAQDRVQAMLERFGLEGLAQRHPLALSEGQRKRVALASVLVTRPRVLVLDEPTLGQDATEKDRLLALVAEVKKQGAAVLVITHDSEFAAACCDRLAIVQEGRIRTVGPLREVLMDEQAFLAARLVPPQLWMLSRQMGMPPALGVDEFLK